MSQLSEWEQRGLFIVGKVISRTKDANALSRDALGSTRKQRAISKLFDVAMTLKISTTACSFSGIQSNPPYDDRRLIRLSERALY